LVSDGEATWLTPSRVILVGRAAALVDIIVSVEVTMRLGEKLAEEAGLGKVGGVTSSEGLFCEMTRINSKKASNPPRIKNPSRTRECPLSISTERSYKSTAPEALRTVTDVGTLSMKETFSAKRGSLYRGHS
jgi:hypothetical protein